MTNKEKAKQIRLAAERVFEGERKYSCHAIKTKKLTRSYELLFCPNDRYLAVKILPNRESWLFNSEEIKDQEAHQWRITALCLAAAMAETGDL